MKNRNEEKNYNEIIGKRLKEFRNSKHLSQQELADKLGYESFQSISNIENGRSRIKKDKAILLSQIFGGNENYWLDVNVIYLYEEDRINHEIAEFNDALARSTHENQLMFTAIVCLAKLNGYDVTINDLSNGNERVNVAEYLSNMKKYMILSKDADRTLTLSIQDANELGNNLSVIFQSNIDLLSYLYNQNRSNT